MAEEKKPENEDLKARLRHLAGEIEHLRHEFGIDLEEIRAHISTLTERVEERIRPEEVEEVRRMVDEMRALLEGLLLPFRRGISKELEERALWLDRISRGECELVTKIEGKYAVYETWRHRPTGETWVRTTARAYT